MEIIKEKLVISSNSNSNKNSKSKSGLSISNMNMMEDEENHVCQYCNKVTKTARGLEQHIQKYCIKNKKIEYHYDNLIDSAKNLIENYAIFMKHYDNIKTGTSIVYHPSIVELVTKSNVFKAVDKIVNNSVSSGKISTPKNYYGKMNKLKLKGKTVDNE